MSDVVVNETERLSIHKGFPVTVTVTIPFPVRVNEQLAAPTPSLVTSAFSESKENRVPERSADYKSVVKAEEPAPAVSSLKSFPTDKMTEPGLRRGHPLSV